MTNHEATEQAYKKGYEDGFKEGYDGGFDVGKRHAIDWIPVTERLPDCADNVLAIDCDGYMSTSYYTGRWHGNGDLDEDAVTHWMHLPEPPKGE